MWPWGHAALAYLLYAGWRRARDRPLTDGRAVALGVGVLVPDLVDKPLHWWVGVLPSGRTLAHSVFVVAVVSVAVLAVARRTDHGAVAGAFLAGWWAHLPGDAIPTLLADGPAYLSFLAWPLLPAPVYPEGPELLVADPLFRAELLLTGVALGVWYRGGLPGLALLRRWTVGVVRRG